MFKDYWKKIIDYDENQTELASMDAATAFDVHQLDKILVRHDSRDDKQHNNTSPKREGMASDSNSQGSDMTVLPEEVCVVSIGSDDSDTAKLRKEKAIKRRKYLVEQQKSYMAFMAQFYPHDAHVKTHREFVEM